jgi:hypothetical protein
MSTNAMAIRFVAIGVLLVCAAAMRAQPTMSSNASNGAIGSIYSETAPDAAASPITAHYRGQRQRQRSRFTTPGSRGCTTVI